MVRLLDSMYPFGAPDLLLGDFVIHAPSHQVGLGWRPTQGVELMLRNLWRGIAVAGSTLLAGAMLAPSAQSDIVTFPDVGGHITSVRVGHGPATVGVTTYDAEMEFTTRYELPIRTTLARSTELTSSPMPRSSR
jgi:hypothetical protein